MSAGLVPDLTTMLFVPASRPRMVEKARGLDAPAVIIDLEDGVGLGEKTAARTALAEGLTRGWPERPVLFVRINGPASEYFSDDVGAIAACAPYGVCIPKCETADEVRRAEWEMMSAGVDAGMRLVPFIESARGIVNATAIASVSERIVAVALGSEDLAADMGLRRTKRGDELAYFRAAVATAARAAGVLAIDGVFIDFHDPAGLEADAAAGRALGFSGKQIIHPAQVEPVARAYAPTTEELERAGRIVAAFEAAERDGAGVVVVDGRMVDRPIVLQARRLLKLR